MARPVNGVACKSESRSTPSSSAQAIAFERRAEARYPTRDAAEIQLARPGGEPIYGTVLDVSRSGLRIDLPARVEKGEIVRVKLHHVVISGEVRYCRAAEDRFQAGILIREVLTEEPSRHLSEDELSLYAVGKGLTVTEVIQVRDHLAACRACRVRWFEIEAQLNPPKQRIRASGQQP